MTQRSRALAASLAMVLLAAGASEVTAATGRLSVNARGQQGNDDSAQPSISGDGRVVAFASRASNLVAGDSNRASDIFVRVLGTRAVRRVSVGPRGSNGGSFNPVVADRGGYVVFSSNASNLVPGDRNGVRDVFIADLARGDVSRMSVGTGGREANGESLYPGVSGDGRFVVFASRASDLVRADTNSAYDIFLRDRRTDATSRISFGPGERQSNGSSIDALISANARWVAYSSDASNLVRGDTNGVGDAFLFDRANRVTRRVSVRSGGGQANGRSYPVAIAPDGRYVLFVSTASNLVAGDGNGVADVFLHDRERGRTERVSVAASGRAGNGPSDAATFSGSGRYVVFRSLASNLASRDRNASYDVFLRDRAARTTRRLSVSRAGGEPNRGCFDVATDRAAATILLSCAATNLVRGDTNGADDVFRVRR